MRTSADQAKPRALHRAASRRARDAYVDGLGLQRALERAKQIRRLRVVFHKGKLLRQIHCTGTSGHPWNAQRWLLWSLLDLRSFTCPLHHGR